MPLHCLSAHHVADPQPELSDELMWDQRAREAHEHVADEDLRLGLESVDLMLPSLHC